MLFGRGVFELIIQNANEIGGLRRKVGFLSRKGGFRLRSVPPGDLAVLKISLIIQTVFNTLPGVVPTVRIVPIITIITVTIVVIMSILTSIPNGLL